MAVTKTHPIKSTLKAAIDYILNPEKTDGKLLASSFGCGLETADIEFAWTREAAGDRGTHLGRHLIQSFAVGETTPEEAHKIGMELAGAVETASAAIFIISGTTGLIAVKSRLLLHEQFKRPLLALCEIHSGCTSFPAGIKKRRYFLPQRG